MPGEVQNINALVGRWLKSQRRRARLSLADASKALGDCSIEAFELGDRGIPCCELVALVEFYRVPQPRLHKFLLRLQLLQRNPVTNNRSGRAP